MRAGLTPLRLGPQDGLTDYPQELTQLCWGLVHAPFRQAILAMQRHVLTMCGHFQSDIHVSYQCQWCGLRLSVLGKTSRLKTSVLVLYAVVLVLQVWCCVVKHGLVTLAIIMTLKDSAVFKVLFIVSLFRAWNNTTVEINSGVYLLKS